MNEKVKEARNKAVEFWNKYNRRQRTLMISIVLAVIVFIAVLSYALTRPEYVTLLTCDSATTASEVKKCLEEAGITTYTMSDSFVVKVLKNDKVDAEMAIATAGIEADGYSIDDYSLKDALDGGFSSTESDKEKKYLAYLESKLQSSLASQDYVKAAKVTIKAPKTTLSVLDKQEDTSVSIILNLKKEIDSSKAENIAQWVATAVGNDSTSEITIIDTAGNMLFRGTDFDGDDYSGGSKAEMRQAAMDIVSSNIKKLFDAAELYQTVEVSPYLDMNFDVASETEVAYNTGDREQGPYTASYEVEQVGGTASGGIPGTDSNDEDITYELQDSSSSKSEYTLKKYDYAVNQIVSNTTKERGKIDYTSSTVSIVASSYNIYEEDVVRAAGQLDDMTWDEFKSAYAENVVVPIPEEIYNLVSDATGFDVDNITIIGYQIPQFVDSIPEQSNFTDYIPVIFAILILALLGFVVFKSTRPVEIIEQEPELSVEDLLATTKEGQEVVEDIDMNDKSDTRIAIEKFVDENPEAVALLLRNWLNEGWE
ncbi:MAG: hypothetical protein K2M78_14005 [Lachnospiraceae bacterium]|nr:hypothetical protein [Lachnospiraceae bacterium]